MKHLFLIGMLCGVMITAAVTYVFAIPANSDYWRMEIWKRGGAAWTVDKKGHSGWMWMVDPTPDTPPCKASGCSVVSNQRARRAALNRAQGR